MPKEPSWKRLHLPFLELAFWTLRHEGFHLRGIIDLLLSDDFRGYRTRLVIVSPHCMVEAYTYHLQHFFPTLPMLEVNSSDLYHWPIFWYQVTRVADWIGVGVHFNPFVEYRDKVFILKT